MERREIIPVLQSRKFLSNIDTKISPIPFLLLTQVLFIFILTQCSESSQITINPNNATEETTPDWEGGEKSQGGILRSHEILNTQDTFQEQKEKC